MSSASQKFQRVQLGDGTIDVSWCIRELEALGYTGDYALEFELTKGGTVDTGMKNGHGVSPYDAMELGKRCE